MRNVKLNASTKKNGKGRKASIAELVTTQGIVIQREETDAAVIADGQTPPWDETDAKANEEPTPKGKIAGIESKETEPQVQLLDLNRIITSAYNPRKDIREETLLELADSIRQSGVLQPICVRPKDDGYEIVFGERRYWAAAMADLKFIPAIVRDLTDAEAEDAAITENLQREDVKPMEEAAAYKRAIQSGRHTVESLVGKFGKSQAYIRSRLKLCELIEPLAELLNKDEISVGVATEIAKYDADIQQEVFGEHFAEGCYRSWKNARIKEVARQLYERYMTKLDTYRFDKTDCKTCQHNTANQVLFAEACEGGCAGCQNRECMICKNEEFLLQKALKLLRDDPRTMLAAVDETPQAVLESLEADGYHVEQLEYDAFFYDEAPQMPEQPQPCNYATEEDFSCAMDVYEAELAEFTEQTQQLEFDIKEGRIRKYAVIDSIDVEIRYEEVPEEEREVTVDDADGERKVLVTVIPPSPLETLRQQDYRNRQLCYEHITAKMKDVLSSAKITNKPLLKEEQQMFYYAVMRQVGSETRLKQCGIRPKKDSWLSEDEQYAAAGRITPKQQAALMRAFLANFFCITAPKNGCTDETLETRLLCHFADLNFEQQSRAVQQEYLSVYEKRKERLQEQIDALIATEEAAAQEASTHDEPELEPEEIPQEEPVASPDTDPQPVKEPVAFPIEPDFEPQTDVAA